MLCAEISSTSRWKLILTTPNADCTPIRPGRTSQQNTVDCSSCTYCSSLRQIARLVVDVSDRPAENQNGIEMIISRTSAVLVSRSHIRSLFFLFSTAKTTLNNDPCSPSKISIEISIRDSYNALFQEICSTSASIRNFSQFSVNEADDPPPQINRIAPLSDHPNDMLMLRQK